MSINPEVQVPSIDEAKSSNSEYVNSLGSYNMRQADSSICNNGEPMSIYPEVDAPFDDKLLSGLDNHGAREGT